MYTPEMIVKNQSAPLKNNFCPFPTGLGKSIGIINMNN